MESATLPIHNGLENGVQFSGMVTPAGRPINKENTSISHINYNNGSELFRFLEVNGGSPNIIEVVPDIRPPSNASSVDGSKSTYFCVFCKVKVIFNTYLEAQFHFGKHLNYAPVICLICSGRFQDLDSVMKHFKDDHSGTKDDNFLYYVNNNIQIEKWIEDYLNFQISQDIYTLLNPDYCAFCPVCNQLTKPTEENHMKSVRIPMEIAMPHVLSHLNYRPYRCNLCYKTGLFKSFSVINEEAKKHIHSHGYAPSEHLLSIFFIKTSIEPLDSFIQDFLLSEWFPMANMQTNIHQTQSLISPHTFVISPMLASTPRQQGLIPKSAYTKAINSQLTLLLHNRQNSPQTSPQLKMTEKVPRPPNVSQKRPSPSSPITYSKSLQFTTKKLTNSSVPVICVHCRMNCKDVLEFKKHHSEQHPNLTLAGIKMKRP
ncbi:uncharacterized protein LOC141854326 [Brevipalpus obovatus]|uniref:uncharacterized protein LOC141854326 n=1 Tax=Brevipalpus obovatus TaxID=246614 RepID=UPI003D9F6AA5